jgi:hypothetical protein
LDVVVAGLGKCAGYCESFSSLLGTKNPTWIVHFLDRQSLETYISKETIGRIFQKNKSLNAFANQVRLELLHEFGGVWADATTICAAPLDQWLPECMKKGFFAFSLPYPERMLSNWFIAAVPSSYMLEKWRIATWEYWEGRTEMHNYFWMHGLFSELYKADDRFRQDWDETPKISAQHRFHFGPDAPRLFEPVPQDIEEVLANPPAPVFKLTHKLSLDPGSDSLYKYLCRYAIR